MRKKIEFSTLAIDILIICIVLMSENTVSAEHYDMVYSVKLYHYEGPPKIQQPFSADTIIAGTPDTLVAKIFDRNSVWLSEYERSDSGRMYIRWKVESLNGIAVDDRSLLSDTCGYKIVVKSSNAYQPYRIIASFKAGFNDTALLYVRPVSQPHKLIIQLERAFRASYGMNVDTLRLTKTVTSIYAIIIDPFGNFIRYANDAVWSSSDTTSIVTKSGDTASGECILIANSENLKSAKIIVHAKIDGTVDTLIATNNIVTTVLKNDQNSSTNLKPVFYVDNHKLRIQIPFAATRNVHFYTLSGNCVSSLTTKGAHCFVEFPPGLYVATSQIAKIDHSISTRVLVGH